jgi:hypothetical protein
MGSCGKRRKNAGRKAASARRSTLKAPLPEIEPVAETQY